MFLAGILVTVVLVTMFIGAALALAPSSFLRAQQSENLAAAERAAHCGLEYALARLQSDPAWKGQAAADIQPTNELTVHEENGNVVGLLRSASGVTSQFRLRFNLQNGQPSGDFDGLPDPSAAMKIDFPMVSFNNLMSSEDLTVPGQGSGGGSVSNPNGSNGKATGPVVPGQTVYLAIEGRAGNGLASLTPADLNGALNGGFSRKVLQASYEATSLGQPVTDAVTMGANNITFRLPGDTSTTNPSGTVQMDGDSSPRLRSKKDLTITGGDSPNFIGQIVGEYRVPQTGTASVQTGSGSLLAPKEELPSDGFYKVEWGNVPKANTNNKIDAGTYVVWDDGTIHYYDVAPKDYPAFIDANPNNTGTTITLPATLANGAVHANSSSGKVKIDVDKDVHVVASASGVADFGILPRKGAPDSKESATGAGGGAAVPPTALTFNYGDYLVLQPNTTNQYMAAPYINSFLQSYMASQAGGGQTLTLASVSDTISVAPDGTINVNGAASINDLITNLQSYAATTGGSQFNAMIAAPPPNSSVDVPTNPAASSSTTNPEDIQITLKSGVPGKNIIFDNLGGSLVFGAQMDGKSSSLVTAGNFRLIGAGASLASGQLAKQSLSVYAKGDIILSTYNPTNGSTGDHYNSIDLTGVIYTWGNFRAILGSNAVPVSDWGKLALTGSLVAYGGNPSGDPGSEPSKGLIEVRTSEAKLNFSSKYLFNLQPPTGNAKFSRRWFNLQ